MFDRREIGLKDFFFLKQLMSLTYRHSDDVIRGLTIVKDDSVRYLDQDAKINKLVKFFENTWMTNLQL